MTLLCNRQPKAGKLFFYTKLNGCVGGYCIVNKYRELHSELMKIATVSGLKIMKGAVNSPR